MTVIFTDRTTAQGNELHLQKMFIEIQDGFSYIRQFGSTRNATTVSIVKMSGRRVDSETVLAQGQS